MRRQAPELPAASRLIPLEENQSNRNTVMRVGAFSEVQAKKAALGKSYRRRVATRLPDKAKSRKAPDQRLNRLISWESHPLPPTPIWMARGYLHLTSRTIATTASHGGDPGWPPIKGSAGKHDRERQRDSRIHILWCDPYAGDGLWSFNMRLVSNLNRPTFFSRARRMGRETGPRSAVISGRAGKIL